MRMKPYRTMMRLPWLLFVFMLTALEMAADDGAPIFVNINVSDGLPHNTVQKIFQDSDGFIWFATKDGLCRHDGRTCLSYRESLSHKSISNSKIRCVIEDGMKRIWAGTDNGLNMIDPVDGSIESFFSSSEPLLKSDKINDLYFDGRTGLLWVATDRGISIFDVLSFRFVELESCPAFGSETNVIYGADDIYIGTSHGLYRCDCHACGPESLGDGLDFAAFSILEDSAGNVWFGNDRTGFGKVTADGGVEFLYCGRPQDDDCSDVYSIIEKDDILWLVTKRNGIFLYDMSSGRSKGGFQPDPGTRTMLTCGYIDFDGNIWIGSYYEGVFLWSPYMNHFYREDITGAGGEDTGIIGPIVKDGDRLWFGSDEFGIVSYNPEDGTQAYYSLGSGGGPLAECKPMLVDNGILWIGTESHGVRLVDTYIYQGEELGYWGVQDNGDEYVRTPVMWDEAGQDVAREALGGKIDNAMLKPEISVESQDRDPRSLLNHYRNFARLRNAFPALADGQMERHPVYCGTNENFRQICAYYRVSGDQRMLVTHNFSSKPVSIKLDDNLKTPVGLSGNAKVAESGTGFTLTLGAWSSVVFLL